MLFNFWFSSILVALAGISCSTSTTENNDTIIDPCKNFGKYICTDYFKTHEEFFNKNFRKFNKFQDIESRIYEEKIHLFSQPIDENEHQLYKLVKRFFQSCTDTEKQKERGYEPLLQIFDSIGGVPFIKGPTWNSSNWTFRNFVDKYPVLPDLLFEFEAQGYEIIVRQNVEYFNINYQVREILEALIHQHEPINDLLSQFNNISYNIKADTNIFDINRNVTHESDIRNKDVIEYIDSVIRMDRPCNGNSLCFRQYLPERISSTEFYVNYDSNNLNRLKNTLGRLSDKSLANLFAILVINQMQQFLYQKHQSTITRLDVCLQYVDNFLFHAGQNLYRKTSLNQNLEQVESFVTNFIHEIQEDFSEFLNKSSGLEDGTKNYMIFFIKNLQTVLHFNENELEKFYRHLADVNGTEFFEMVISLGSFKIMNDFEKFRSRYDDLVNLATIKKDGELVIQGGILYIPPAYIDKEFISEMYDDAINFAHLGYTVIKIFLEKIVSFVVNDLNKKFSNNEYNSQTLARNHTYLTFTVKNRTQLQKKLFWIALTRNDCYPRIEDLSIILSQLAQNVGSGKQRDRFQEIYDLRFTEKQLSGFQDAFECPLKAKTYKLFLEDANQAQNVSICETNVCITTASRVNQMANRYISPCQNFMEHACGGFIANNVLNDRYYSISFYKILYDKIAEQRRKVLSEDIRESDIAPLKLAKRYFIECAGKFTSSHLDNRGIKPLLKLLKNLGKFPLTDPDWDENQWSLNDIIRKFPLIYFWIYKFEFDEMNTLSIRTNKFKVIRDDSILVQVMYSFISDLAAIKSSIREFKNFIQCLTAQLPAEQSKCDYLEKNSIYSTNSSDVHLLVDSVLNLKMPCERDDDECLHNLFPGNSDWDNANVTHDMQDIGKLTKILTRTPKRILADNFLIMIVANEMNFLSTKYLKFYNLKRNSGGFTKKLPQRWEICVETVFKYMKHALHALHYEKYMTDSLKQGVTEFSNQIVQDYIHIIETSDKFTEEMKMEFTEKLLNYQLVIAYSNEVLNKTNLINYYKDWETNESEYFEMSIFLQLQYEKQKFNRFDKNFIDLDDFTKNIIVEDNYAYENLALIDNRLYIFFMIFQEQFFSKNNLDFVNYSELASKILRAIVRATVNGRRDQIEMLSIAYTVKLYDYHIKQVSEKRRLPGLTAYTNRQMLYLMMAQDTCYVSRKNNLYENAIIYFPDWDDIFECNR